MICNQIQLPTFNFNNQGIRVIIIGNEPWFIAADVCAVLEHTNTSVALSRLKEYEKQLVDPKQYLGSVSNQYIAAISESGLYRLVLTSRKPQAESSKILGLKPRRSTTALLLNISTFTKYMLKCEVWKKPILTDFTPHQHKSRYCGAHWAV